MVAQQELIMVCADNSYCPEHFESQLDAIHVYCHAKLKSNPKTAVGIFTMARGSPTPFGCLLRPSSDLDEIMAHAQGITRGGELDFIGGIMHSMELIDSDQPNVQQRLLIFARGPTDTCYFIANHCGNMFKEHGIAVDLVNFCPAKEPAHKRRALNIFVDAVNNNENSRIKHLVAGYSIRDLLSSIPAIITPEEIAAAADLKMPPRFSMKTKVIKVKLTMDPNMFFKELKKKSKAAEDDEYNAHGIKYAKRAPLGLVNKLEALTEENEEIASADVAKKNQAAAGMEYGKHVPQEILNKLEALTLENEKLKLENEKLKLELYGKGKEASWLNGNL